jgi:hypothetical protein
MTTERCDPEVYERGEFLCVLHARKEQVESWCQLVAALSGNRVDWSYVAGRAVVKFLGNKTNMAELMESLTPRMVR